MRRPANRRPLIARLPVAIVFFALTSCHAQGPQDNRKVGQPVSALRHGSIRYSSTLSFYRLDETRGILVPEWTAPDAWIQGFKNGVPIDVQELNSEWLWVSPGFFLRTRDQAEIIWSDEPTSMPSWPTKMRRCPVMTSDAHGRLFATGTMTHTPNAGDDRSYWFNYVWRGEQYTLMDDFSYVSNSCIMPLGRGTALTRTLSSEASLLLARISSADRSLAPEMLKLPEEFIPYSGEQGFPDLDLSANDLKVLFQEVLDASGEFPAHLIGSCAQPFDTMPLSAVEQAKEDASEWLKREVGGDLEEAMQQPSFFLSDATEDFAVETVRRLTLLHHREILLLASDESATEWMLIPGTEELTSTSRPAGWGDRAHSHTYRVVGQNAVVLLGLTSVLEWGFEEGSRVVVDKPENDVSTLYKFGLGEHWIISPLSDTRCRFELPWGQGMGAFWTLWGRMDVPFPTAKGK